MRELLCFLVTIWMICSSFQNKYEVKDFNEDYCIEINVEDTDGDRYSGVVVITAKSDHKVLVEQKFENMRVFSEAPDGRFISFEDQDLIYLKDKNFDGDKDIVIVYENDMYRYLSSIYVSRNSTLVYDSLINEAYNWWNIEVSVKNQVVYADGFNGRGNISSCVYHFKDGKVSRCDYFREWVLGNGFIQIGELEKYKVGGVSEISRKMNLAAEMDAKILLTFDLKEKDLKAYFASSDGNLHFALTKKKSDEVLFYYPKKYPYDSPFFYNPVKKQLSFMENNKEYKINFEIMKDSITKANIEINDKILKQCYKSTNNSIDKRFNPAVFRNVNFEYR